MKLDLDKMSREELMDLRAKVDDAIAAAAEREKQAAIAAAEEAARKYGFSLNQLGITGSSSARRKARAAGPKNPPRYRNPDDPTQTWSGRGRRPQWVKDAEANGTPLAEMAI